MRGQTENTLVGVRFSGAAIFQNVRNKQFMLERTMSSRGLLYAFRRPLNGSSAAIEMTRTDSRLVSRSVYSFYFHSNVTDVTSMGAESVKKNISRPDIYFDPDAKLPVWVES